MTATPISSVEDVATSCSRAIVHGSASTAPIGLTDALHNLFRLVEREHNDLEVMRLERARDRQLVAELVAQVDQLTALVERNEATARTHRGRIDSLEMRMP